ncbi:MULTISPECIES: hypothetical protein [unclassified Microbacterium]|uniref:hypothetical protein n=1 Tax=unclassified Microbacterium TaxID=2609290 RepID=UPI00301B06F3
MCIYVTLTNDLSRHQNPEQHRLLSRLRARTAERAVDVLLWTTAEDHRFPALIDLMTEVFTVATSTGAGWSAAAAWSLLTLVIDVAGGAWARRDAYARRRVRAKDTATPANPSRASTASGTRPPDSGDTRAGSEQMF